MGEIDTKPIEPVQVALTLFGEKGDHHKWQRSSSGRLEIICSKKLFRAKQSMEKYLQEVGKEIEFEGLLKDLSNCKVQLEAKESAYLQLLLKFKHYQTTVEKLCNQLQSTEAERDAFIEESREAKNWIEELESKVKEMVDQLSESGKLRDQLSNALCELKARHGEMLVMETELASAKEAELKALMKAELAETSVALEKERMEDLLKHVVELNEAVVMSRMEGMEVEKEKCRQLAEKDVEIEQAREIADDAQQQVEEMRNQLEMKNELENQLRAKSTLIDSLQAELTQTNESVSLSQQTVLDALYDLDQLKAEFGSKEKENSDTKFYAEALESELNQLKLDHTNESDKVSTLNCDVQELTEDLLKVKAEMDEIKERENEAQVEIAMLKAQLHEGRSKLAAANAAEARAESLKSGLYLAVQQLAAEAEEARQENIRLKRGEENVAAESDRLALVFIPDENNSEETRMEYRDMITIPTEEYESLITRAQKAEQSVARYSNQLTRTNAITKSEMESLKKELEAAIAKMGEFRTRAEQAATRAEAAEKAKTNWEDQIKRWKERRQKRKVAFAALNEESSSRDFSNSYSTASYDSGPKSYQTLYKVLGMKF